MTIKAVACFCGARDGARPIFKEAARALGRGLAERGFTLVYGGGASGMMGAVADSVLEAGGQVFGVIPHGLARAEFAHARVTALHRVETMHERKAMMEKLSDAFIALPGGFGTLDELFEIATWSQIGLHQKPIGLLDTDGYWDGVQAQIQRGIAEGFIAEHLRELIVIEHEPEKLLERLVAHSPPEPVVKWLK
jgi:uncharacterized protein (TIGR00730 family)